FFFLDLTAANVALICLFSDSLNALFPSISVVSFKLIGFVTISPLSFVSLKFLSFTSVIGIFGTSLLLLITVFNGLYNCTSPGSLLHPASTTLFPTNLNYLPLSIGLFMSPFGGLPVFPSIYRDMRQPVKFPRAASISYAIATGLEFSMGIIGYLMFGRAILPEVTQSVLDTGRVVWLNAILVAVIAIVPVSKMPLSVRPICVTLDGIFKVNGIFGKSVNRVLANAVPVLLSILFPKFERVVGFAGAFLCFSICVVFPLLFYMKIFEGQISLFKRIVMWIVIVWGTISAGLGTIWACESLFLKVSL
ncbi:Vacuolar amino acid transporter 1, partial [Neolecta irregularis DAH-3]